MRRRLMCAVSSPEEIDDGTIAGNGRSSARCPVGGVPITIIPIILLLGFACCCRSAARAQPFLLFNCHNGTAGCLAPRAILRILMSRLLLLYFPLQPSFACGGMREGRCDGIPVPRPNFVVYALPHALDQCHLPSFGQSVGWCHVSLRRSLELEMDSVFMTSKYKIPLNAHLFSRNVSSPANWYRM